MNLLIGNTAPVGSPPLNYILGGVSGSGIREAGDSGAVAPITGTYTADVGVNSFSITASDPNASNNPQSVEFSQTAYGLAAAAASQTVDVGAFHVGTSKTVSVMLTNTAATDPAFTDTLQSNGFSGTSADFSANGSASGIAGGTAVAAACWRA